MSFSPAASRARVAIGEGLEANQPSSHLLDQPGGLLEAQLHPAVAAAGLPGPEDQDAPSPRSSASLKRSSYRSQWRFSSGAGRHRAEAAREQRAKSRQDSFAAAR